MGEPMALTADAFYNNADWRNAARCRDTDPGLFFPIGSTGLAVEQIAAAKEVCLGCSCREACLEFALSTNQDTGVWGGTSEDERRAIRRQRRQQRLSIH
jgi:WhiB family redox-sensing transcriptional regulator